MGKLLKFELRKVFLDKNIYICTGVCMFLVLLVDITTKITAGDMSTSLTGANFAQSAISTLNVILISGIFVSIYICEDFTLGTIKNIYGKGYGKDVVFFTKFIVSLIAILMMSVLSMLTGYLYGVIFCSHDLSISKEIIFSLLSQLLVVIAYLSLYFFVSITLRKNGSSIAINIVVPIALEMILLLVDTFLKLENFKFSTYWLGTMMSSLHASEIPTKSFIIAVVGSLIYIAIFLLAGFFINRKREIK